MKEKVVIIGCGSIGSAYAYNLINQRKGLEELILIDIDEDKALRCCKELSKCLGFFNSNVVIKTGSYSECSNAKIVALCASSSIGENESKSDLIYKNSLILKSIIQEVMKNNFQGIFLVCTNPLDVMTTLVLKYSGVESKRVIGLGTLIDTSYLRYLLSKRLDCHIDDIDAFVIGAHGEDQIVPWDIFKAGMLKITDLLTSEILTQIEEQVNCFYSEIFTKSDISSFSAAQGLATVTNAILDNKKMILTVSCYDKKNNVCYSMPAKITNEGCVEIRWVEMSNEENNRLYNCYQHVLFEVNSVLEI